MLKRLHQIFNGVVIFQKYLKKEGDFSKVELLIFQEAIDKWRLRLQADFLNKSSWFMRVLNGAIAREANAEDGLHGLC